MTTPITGQGLNVCIPPDDELSLTSKKAAQNKVITEELTDLSNAISQLQPTATSADIGKALIVKTVDQQTGKPTSYEYGEAGGGDTSNCAPIIINTASGDIASFADGADNRQIRKIVGTIVPQQSGTGDPSPDNVRPISGWTECKIMRTNSNLFGGIEMANRIKTVGGSGATLDTENKTISCWAPAWVGKKIINIPFKENTSYTIVLIGNVNATSSRNTQLVVKYTDGSESNLYFDQTDVEKGICRFVTPNTKTVFSLNGTSFGNTTKLYYDECGIFEGVVTADDFVAYTGTTLPINWQSSAGTIYGGTVTLNEDGSADVVSNVARIDLGNINWSTLDSVTGQYNAGNLLPSGQRFYSNEMWCEKYLCADMAFSNNAPYSVGTNDGSSSYYRMIWIYDPDCATAADMKTALQGVYLYYISHDETAIQTYHISNIGQLYTYLGANNVWIDTGAITECVYPADTKLYVDGLTAPDEDMIANANIASGKYFVVNNQLYLSTAAIAAGASIVPGTNCTATNLAEALNAINT